MDYATSLSEAQQQLLAQYQQHLQQQQQQQQQQPQQQPQQAPQAYDPTQLQSYDPSSQAYYSYHQAYQTPVAQHQHPQQYPYYTPDYGASAAVASSNVYQADAVSQAQDPSASAQQFYPQDQQAAYNASLNPAAAAAVHALSQLTQFAGTMDAQQRAVAEQQWSNGGPGPVPPPQAQVQHAGMVHPHAGGGPYRGGGRRGGGPFRGGKGNFGHRHQRQDGGSFRGRGRGRGGGGGRRFPAPEVQATYPVHAAEVPQPYAEPGTVYEPSQAAMPGPGPALANAASRRTTTVIFCELCRVECNSGEIFEKHKIGKRHKKNLQRLEELEHQKKQTTESDMRQRRTAVEAELQQKTEQPEYLHFDGENAASPQDAGVTDTANEIAVEGGQQSQMVEQSQTPKGDMFNASAKKRKRDNNIKKPPLKRKTSFVQDGKRMRVEPSRPEAPKELPVHCALCNVTCDTMAVFQCHLSGKKHASRIKRSQIQTIAYVPPTGVALYIPYGAGHGPRPPPVGSEPVSQEGSAPISLDHQAAVTEPVSQQLTATITEDLQAAAAEPLIQQVSAMTTEEYQGIAEEPVDQDVPMVGPDGQNTELEPELKDVSANDAFIPTAECGDQTVDDAIPSSLGIEAEEPSSGVELQ